MRNNAKRRNAQSDFNKHRRNTLTTPEWKYVSPYNLIVTAIISLVIGWLGRFIYDKFRFRTEKRQKEPVQKALLKRIADHCRLLTSFMSLMACDSPKGCVFTANYVKESKEALLRCIGELGNDAASSETKKAILELERRLDVLIALAQSRKYISDEKWMEDISNVLAQIESIGRLIKNDAVWVSAGALHDTYKRKLNV
jgi:hypothetical protein